MRDATSSLCLPCRPAPPRPRAPTTRGIPRNVGRERVSQEIWGHSEMAPLGFPRGCFRSARAFRCGRSPLRRLWSRRALLAGANPLVHAGLARQAGTAGPQILQKRRTSALVFTGKIGHINLSWLSNMDEVYSTSHRAGKGGGMSSCAPILTPRSCRSSSSSGGGGRASSSVMLAL
jgi:hypothetical protein